MKKNKEMARVDDTQYAAPLATASENELVPSDEQACPRCGNDTVAGDVIDGRCGECRLHEDEADWDDEADGPLN